MNKKCRWNVADSEERSQSIWVNCGKPVTVYRKGMGYCAEHDPVANSKPVRIKK